MSRARPPRRAAGCVVYRHDSDQGLLLLLICDRYGRWTLPKGHVEWGERAKDTAVREVREETGISGDLGPPIARIEYTVVRKGTPRHKLVDYFLLRAASAEATPQEEEGISAVGWFPPAEALALTGYELVRGVIERALGMIGGDGA